MGQFYLRGTHQNYVDCHRLYCLELGWSEYEVEEGREDCYELDASTGQWNIKSASTKTRFAFGCVTNPENPNDCLFQDVGQDIANSVMGPIVIGVNKITETQYNLIVNSWFPPLNE